MTPQNKHETGATRRQVRLLARRDWVYLLSLLTPFVLYGLVLKISLIASLPGDVAFVEGLSLTRSDLLFDLGYSLFWVGLFAAVRDGLLRRLVIVLFHATTVLVALIVTASYQFLRSTGSALDYHTMLYALTNLGDVRSLIASAASPTLLVFVATVVAYAALGPWLLTRLLGRWRGWPTVRSEALATPWLVPLGACLLAYALLSFSILPGGPSDVGGAFSRDPFVDMVAAGFREKAAPEAPAESYANVPRMIPPDASLIPTERTRKRNVVLVVLDSTRARSVTPYESLTPSDQDEGEPPITPFMDLLAQNSLMAERAYAVVPHTTNGLTATNCGVAPPLDRAGTESLAGGVPTECLPDLLKEQGYRTAFFQSATEEFENRRRVAKNLGYEDFFPVDTMDKKGFEEANYFGYEDDIMLEPSEKWLKQNRGRPFMATYLTVTAHHDYRAPQKRYGREKLDEDEEVNRYLNTVRYEDFFLKNLFEQYEKLGLYKDTVFVVVGDHGEAFGEHNGLRQHDNVPYEESLRIPMMVHDPQRYANGNGARVAGPASQTDILPTVANLLGYGIKGGAYTGNTLLSLPEDRTLNFSCWGDYKCLASLRGTEKYIYNFGDRPEEVYDLAEDPLEKNNLAEERPGGELEKRREELLGWRARVDAAYEGREVEGR